MTCVPSSIQRILIPTFQTLELVAVEDIVSIKAYENYHLLAVFFMQLCCSAVR